MVSGLLGEPAGRVISCLIGQTEQDAARACKGMYTEVLKQVTLKMIVSEKL